MAKEAKKKVKVEFNADVHGEELARLVKDASDQMIKIEGFRAIISDNKTAAKDKLGVDGKTFTKQLALYHKGIRERFASENNDTVELYDTIFPRK